MAYAHALAHAALLSVAAVSVRAACPASGLCAGAYHARWDAADIDCAKPAECSVEECCTNQVDGCTSPAHIDCHNRTNRAHADCESFIHIAAVFPLSKQRHSILPSLCFEGVQCHEGAAAAVEDINCEGSGCKIAHTGGMDKGGNPLFQFPNTGVAGWRPACPSGANCCAGRNGPDCDSYCLKMHVDDSQGDPGLALKLADAHMNTPWTEYANIDLFIGGLGSEVSESLQQLLQHNEIPQISYGSTSPALSKKDMYPTFVRTVPSDTMLVSGITELIEKYEWSMISILAINREFGQAGAAELYKALNGLNSGAPPPPPPPPPLLPPPPPDMPQLVSGAALTCAFLTGSCLERLGPPPPGRWSLPRVPRVDNRHRFCTAGPCHRGDGNDAESESSPSPPSRPARVAARAPRTRAIAAIPLPHHRGRWAAGAERASAPGGLHQKRVEVVNNLLFTYDNINEQLEAIKDSDSRIIFLHCTLSEAKAVFEQAIKKDMMEEFTWLGSEWAQVRCGAGAGRRRRADRSGSGGFA
jgi:hypothetical protein